MGKDINDGCSSISKIFHKMNSEIKHNPHSVARYISKEDLKALKNIAQRAQAFIKV